MCQGTGKLSIDGPNKVLTTKLGGMSQPQERLQDKAIRGLSRELRLVRLQVREKLRRFSQWIISGCHIMSGKQRLPHGGAEMLHQNNNLF